MNPRVRVRVNQADSSPSYIKGDPKRQEILETALDWVASSQGHSIAGYLAEHRQDKDVNVLKTYFTSVIDWIGSVFTGPPDKDMRGLEWGRLYELYHSQSYDAAKVDFRVTELRSDPALHNPKGIYEFLLGKEEDPRLLSIRIFDDKTKRVAYENQTVKAKADGVSNCPVCAHGDNANKARIYKLAEMDADHVTAWSKGGTTVSANCEMLCAPHNRSKGNN